MSPEAEPVGPPGGADRLLFAPSWSQQRTVERPSSYFPNSFSSSTLAIWLHGKAHLFAFLGCPWDFLRVAVLAPNKQKVLEAFTSRNRLLLLVRTRRRSRRKGHGLPKERLSDPGKRARSDGLAHSGRCELLRRDGLAGAS